MSEQRQTQESRETDRSISGGGPAEHPGSVVVSDLGEASGAAPTPAPPRGRLNLEQDNPKSGIARLLLTLGKALHELMEKQAIRRMDEGSLTEEEVERLGLALMKQAEELEKMRKDFGFEDEELNLDLGPIGRLV